MTEAGFDAALAARGIDPAPEDRAAAFAIARYLDECGRLLRNAEDGTDDPA